MMTHFHHQGYITLRPQCTKKVYIVVRTFGMAKPKCPELIKIGMVKREYFMIFMSVILVAVIRALVERAVRRVVAVLVILITLTALPVVITQMVILYTHQLVPNALLAIIALGVL